jgi:type IV secretion system protein VirB11
MLECELPIDNSRFAGQLPPIVSAPCFAIRKKASQIFTFSQYVDSGIMTPYQCQYLTDCIADKKNVLVVGGTGSGKTTLVNGCIHSAVQSAPDHRYCIIEDTGEIQCHAQNVVQYHTTIDTNMTQLLKITLRMRPDRIIVGEVRGPEALDLLMAWNTGHPGGFATIHANSARAALDRLKMLISMHPNAPHPAEPLIGDAVDVVVHIARTETGRKITEILAVDGYRSADYITSSANYQMFDC